MNSSSCCICNTSNHAFMNQKWNALRCLPRMLDHPIDPRPASVSKCISKCVFQEPVVALPMKQEHVHKQLEHIKHVESQLHGRQRPSYLNSFPYRSPDVPSNSKVWKQHDKSNFAHPQSVVDLRPPTFISTDPDHPQSSSPFNNIAHKPTFTRPIDTSAVSPAHWTGQMPCYFTETSQWNNHPYLLDKGIGVSRHTLNQSALCTIPIQAAFMNNTRRKQNVY